MARAIRVLVFTLGGLLSLGLPPAWSQLTVEDCKARRVLVNMANNGADIAVDISPVTVVLKNDTRCTVLIRNKGTAAMRCLPLDQAAPTEAVGVEFGANDQLLLTTAGRGAWQCVARPGAPTVATTLEELP